MNEEQKLNLQRIAKEASEMVAKLSQPEKKELERRARKSIKAEKKIKKAMPKMEMKIVDNPNGTKSIEYDVNDAFLKMYKKITGKKHIIAEEVGDFIMKTLQENKEIKDNETKIDTKS